MNPVDRIWKHIEFSPKWEECDTSVLDDIAPSWYSRREKLVTNSTEYEEFLNRLKRKHAIETGIVERMYDLDKGVTETLIQEGFISSLVSHGDSNIEKGKLFEHLQDHLDAINFVFDVVKEDRPLTKGFILELHQLTTRNQEFAEGRDQFGNKTQIPLIRGRFKERENNPTRPDGTVVMYCPPEHVDSEMDNLITILDKLIEREIHPLIIASWVHHAFTMIHPFQDGNGRVVRLIASLILIKYDFFPITVLREEAKKKYIKALEEADHGEPQGLVTYFGQIQRRNIEEALNIKEVASTNLSEVTSILKQKIQEKRAGEKAERERILTEKRIVIFEICNQYLNEFKNKLEEDFDNSVTFYMGSGRPEDPTRQHYYYQQIVSYASKHDYYFNRALPKAYFIFGIDLRDNRKYELGISIHHYGYDDSTIAIGAFLEYKGEAAQDMENTVLPLNLPPHVISVSDDVEKKEKNIKAHLENILTMTMAQIASEI